MKAAPAPTWDRETTLVTQLAAAASLVAFLFYFRHSDLLLYGDAVAHINIARRVFDSRTPGLLQLGTVWLPLPHLLMIPFLFSKTSWQTGIGGAIPSMVAYVMGAGGIFRLSRGCFSIGTASDVNARIAAWLAAFVYAANPNLLYMQTTAMTEPLYLCLFIWSVVFFAEFARALRDGELPSARSSLLKCGWCLFSACLTRYDGWFLSCSVLVVAAAVLIRSPGPASLRLAFAKFALLAIAGPLFWLAYNSIIYRNPLEFANGPYSALAIEQKSRLSKDLPHPGWHDLPTAFSYFLRASDDNIAQGRLQKVWLIILAAAIAALIAVRRNLWPLLLLLVPLPFYVLSIAYGSVPIYLSEWWPFSLYNVRFGMEFIPAFAVFSALIAFFLLVRLQKLNFRIGIVVAFLAFVGVSYGLIWKTQPICYREAYVNSHTRVALETALASNLQLLPPDSDLLMYLGDHVGALERAGIPLRRTINEGNHRTWKQPTDPDGLWERALANPQQYVDYVIAIDQDPVAQNVQKRDLTSMVVIRTLGQAPATIYWTQRQTGNQPR